MRYNVTLYLSDSSQSTYSGGKSCLAHFEAIGLQNNSSTEWDDSKHEHQRRNPMRYSETNQHMKIAMLYYLSFQSLDLSYETHKEDDCSSRGVCCIFQ